MPTSDLLVNRGEPKTNFFLFPPLKPAQGLTHSEARHILRLDEEDESVRFVLFISVPYCRVRCHSCHCFKHVLPGRSAEDALLERYVDSLCVQIAGFGDTPRYGGRSVGAVYFGGGTASLLRPKDLERLVSVIADAFALSKDIEITLEGSPREFGLDYLRSARELGIRRLSIGFQSRFDTLLEVLNSPHRSKEGLQSIENALATSFDTVNVDLLYNIPRQTREMWEADIEGLIASDVGSISVGDYMIFPDSPAAKLIERSLNPPQKTQHEVYDWFLWATERLTGAGYEEHVRGIFPKTGRLHDYAELSCAANSDIIGIGVGSYSFLSGHQLRNSINVEDYCNDMKNGDFLSFDSISRSASGRDLRIRYVIHNLFASRVSHDSFERRFGSAFIDDFRSELAELTAQGWIYMDDGVTRLTTEGRKLRKYVYDAFYRAT